MAWFLSHHQLYTALFVKALSSEPFTQMPPPPPTLLQTTPRRPPARPFFRAPHEILHCNRPKACDFEKEREGGT